MPVQPPDFQSKPSIGVESGCQDVPEASRIIE
jgi:hypothetical protein